MRKLYDLLIRLIDRMFDTIEQGHLREYDDYVEQASNAREVSQRIHRLEQLSCGLNA
jgi:hypothetical protein